MRILGFVFLLISVSCGQDWGSLHILNGDIAVGQKWNVQLHSRIRSNNDFGNLFQRRLGPIVSYALRPRISLLGGYYLLNEENRLEEGKTFHRYFGGLTMVPVRRKMFRLESRSVLERFVGTRLGDYWRGRQRLLAIAGEGKFRPYFQIEGLRATEIWVGRTAAGLQYVPSAKWMLAAGYEYRQAPSGPNQHILSTQLQFQLRSRKK